jgi:hypothetical protein
MSKYLLLSPIGPNDTFFGDFASDKEAFTHFACKMVEEFGAESFKQSPSFYVDPIEIAFNIIKNDGNKLELPGVPGSIASFTVHKFASISI